jgi:uncharacterized protein
MRVRRRSLKASLRSTFFKKGDRLHDAVSAQIAVAHTAGELCAALVSGVIASDVARSEMNVIEHQGDDHRATLVRGMTRTLVTPIDREDLFRLSRSIDDVVDDLRDFVRAYDLFQAVPPCDMGPLVDTILEALTELALASDTLRNAPSEAFEATLRTKKRAGAVRHAYQTVLAQMLECCPDPVGTFKNLELLRGLDAAGMSLHDAADALADGALKRVT